jgi:hypothetical protein
VILLKHTDWQVGQGENSMFAKKSLPFGIALVLLIALASLGLAYGAWTDTLTINGDVTTGSLNVDFVGTDGPVADVDLLNAGTCTLDYEDDLVTVTIANAYPGYQCVPMITVKNTGSIPAKVTLNFPADEPVPGVAAGGVALGENTLVPGATIGFSLPFEVYGDPPMGTSYSFTFPIPASQ